ncbi:MAG TPA: sensor histidine kinase [Phototrophicaceae bacterium]|nr:sensor histidine kinase [Phototrophicaceae bacterium]
MWLLQIPTDTLTGHADFYAGQYRLDSYASAASADTKWSTGGILDYQSILRVDARDVTEWLAKGFSADSNLETAWQVGDSHQYLVERRDDSGKRVINVTLQSVVPGDLFQTSTSWLALLAVAGSVIVAVAVALQHPRPAIASPLMLVACGSLLNLTWVTFAVPFSYVALQQPFLMQLSLHIVAATINAGVVVHLALSFPASLTWFVRRRRLILIVLYALYPAVLLLIAILQSRPVDRLTDALAWELQISIALKAFAYLIWAAQYRQASVTRRAQLHWILAVITANDLVYIAEIFSRNHDFSQLQLWFNLLLPIGYGMAMLPGRSLRIRIGSASGFVHGVANTLTLALFLCGLGLVASLLIDSNHISELPLMTVFLAVIFALTTVPLANLLREQFDSWFQGTRSAQRALLYQFTGRVSEHIPLSEVTRAFFETLDQGVQPAETALWLWNDEAQGLEKLEQRGTAHTLMVIDSSLYELLLTLQGFTPVAQVKAWQELQTYHGLVTLVASGKLVGICAIGARIDDRAYSADTIRFFEALARSATLAFRNAQLVNQMEDKIRALQHAYHQVMSAQENERQRLASELHDETLQQLAHVNLLAGGLYNYVDDRGAGAFKELQSIIVLTEHHLREILRGVHPAVLTDLGLIPALRSWLPHPEGITITISTTGFDGKRLPDPALEMTLYRLCQESVNNAIKHACASTIDVRLIRDEASVVLEVIDNGVGFEPSALTSKYQAQNGHFGLMNLRERVNALNGQLIIKSQPGSGTSIRVILPADKKLLLINYAGARADGV